MARPSLLTEKEDTFTNWGPEPRYQAIVGHWLFWVKNCNVQITFLTSKKDIWADKLPGSLIRDEDNRIVNKQASRGKTDSNSFLPPFCQNYTQVANSISEELPLLLPFFVFSEWETGSVGFCDPMQGKMRADKVLISWNMKNIFMDCWVSLIGYFNETWSFSS